MAVAVAVVAAEAEAVAVLTAMLEMIQTAIFIWLGKSYSSRVAEGASRLLTNPENPGGHPSGFSESTP